MELKIGNSCGSCLNSNKPKKPREHAAHYEVAKTERWCFLHNCHVTRECTCDNYTGVCTSAKTSFTRAINFNKRLEIIREIISKMNDREIQIDGETFYVKNNWLYYTYDTSRKNPDGTYYFEHRVNTKHDNKSFKTILDQLL